MAERAVIPAWVQADHRQVVDLHWTAYGLATQLDSLHAQGQLAALGWIVSGERAPITHRTDPATWELARAESWVALCIAAGGEQLPTAEEWARLAVEPRASRVADDDFAHGVWRTLAWLLSVRPDPPTELPDRDANGNVVPDREPRFGLRRDESSPLWQQVDGAWRARNRSEARRWCAHVRRQLRSSEDTPAPGRA
jgi:hypothetical protein